MRNTVDVGRERGRPGHSGGLLERAKIVPDGRYEWQDDALCLQFGQDAFFPEEGDSQKELKKTCGKCAVWSECLEDALRTNEVYYGVRGGLGPDVRRRLLMLRQKAEKA